VLAQNLWRIPLNAPSDLRRRWNMFRHWQTVLAIIAAVFLTEAVAGNVAVAQSREINRCSFSNFGGRKG
jgi:hypothetical protein